MGDWCKWEGLIDVSEIGWLTALDYSTLHEDHHMTN